MPALARIALSFSLESLTSSIEQFVVFKVALLASSSLYAIMVAPVGYGGREGAPRNWPLCPVQLVMYSQDRLG